MAMLRQQSFRTPYDVFPADPLRSLALPFPPLCLGVSGPSLVLIKGF